MDCWSIGFQNFNPVIHYSKNPKFHYSNNPLLHYSNIPEREMAKRRHKKNLKPKISTENWSTGKVLGVIFLVALVFRLSLLAFRFAVGFDEVNYLKLGVAGHLDGLSNVFHTYWAPFFPFLISIFSKFISDYELAGRLVSVVMGSLLVFPVYHLARIAYPKQVGWIAAGFVAIFPPLAFHSTLVLTESTYMLLAALVIFTGWKVLKLYSINAALLAGLLGGLLYLTKPEGLGFLGVLAAFVVLGTVTKLYLIKPLRAVYLLIAMSIGFLAVASPYLIYLKNEVGHWTISTKGIANLKLDTPVDGALPKFRLLNEDNTSVPIDEVFHLGNFVQAGREDGAIDAKAPNYGALVFKYIKNFYKMLSDAIPSFLTTVPMLLLAVGLFGRGWEVRQGKTVFYLLTFIGAYWFFVIPLFHINPRYLMPFWPLLAIWVANGVVVVHGWLQNYPELLRFSLNRQLKPAFTAGIALSAAFVVFSMLPEMGKVVSHKADSTNYYADAVEQKKAGLWLKENGVQRPIIMSRNHTVDVYAGNYDVKQSVTIPWDSLERVIDYAKHRNVDYLVLNERYLKDYPNLKPLLAEEMQRPDLELIYKDQEAPGLKTVVYEVKHKKYTNRVKAGKDY